MNKVKTSLQSIMSEFSDNQLLFQRVFLIVEILLFVIGYTLNHSFFLITIMLMIISTFFFMVTKHMVKLEKAKKQYTAIVLTLIFGCCELINGILFKLPFGKTLSIFVDILIVILIYVKSFPPKRNVDEREKIDAFITDNILEQKSKDGVKYGDTVLGTVKETGLPNTVPYLDRFLHFLILGPTGSGKTSQSLIPMVARDVHYHDMGIVCLEPKGDFAEKVFALAKLAGREDVVYFNPTLKNCPYFNPLRGELNDVIESISTAFASMDGDSKQYFKDMNANLMSSGVTVVKTLYGDDATLINLSNLFSDYQKGSQMIKEFQLIPSKTKEEQDHRKEIANWFTNDYFTGMQTGTGGPRGGTKTYENSSGVRTQLTNLISNAHLRRVLNPPSTSTLRPDQYIDFERVLEAGGVLAMCSAQGALRDLGKTLGMFLIQSFEAAVFRRPGDEDTRKGVIFYVDEFQKYANKGFDDLLTQGRSYRVSSVLATQSRSGIAINSGNIGKSLVDLVSTNARNKVIYPGVSSEDATFYSREFGTQRQIIEKVTVNRGRFGLQRLDFADQRESYSAEEKSVLKFEPSDISIRPFGEAVSSIVYRNSIQGAQVVKLNFISRELNKQVNDYVNKYIRPQATSDYDVSVNADLDVIEKEILENSNNNQQMFAFPEGFKEIESLPNEPINFTPTEMFVDISSPMDENIEGKYNNEFLFEDDSKNIIDVNDVQILDDVM